MQHNGNKYNQYCIALSREEREALQVMEMKIGNTIIRGYDDAAVKTEEECQEILDHVGRIAAGIYREKEQKEGNG